MRYKTRFRIAQRLYRRVQQLIYLGEFQLCAVFRVSSKRFESIIGVSTPYLRSPGDANMVAGN